MEQLTAWLTGPESIEFRGGPVPQPGPGELLISVGAAVTCGTDVKVYRRGGHPKMLEVPSPFGHELAGTIVSSGEGVEGWREPRQDILGVVPPLAHVAAASRFASVVGHLQRASGNTRSGIDFHVKLLPSCSDVLVVATATTDLNKEGKPTKPAALCHLDLLEVREECVEAGVCLVVERLMRPVEPTTCQVKRVLDVERDAGDLHRLPPRAVAAAAGRHGH